MLEGTRVTPTYPWRIFQLLTNPRSQRTSFRASLVLLARKQTNASLNRSMGWEFTKDPIHIHGTGCLRPCVTNNACETLSSIARQSLQKVHTPAAGPERMAFVSTKGILFSPRALFRIHPTRIVLSHGCNRT